MSFLDRIEECNDHDLSRFRPFRAGDAAAGWVRRDHVGALARFDDVFAVSDDAVTLRPDLDDFRSRSAAMANVAGTLVRNGLIPRLRGEDYGVSGSFSAQPLFTLDRGAVPFFGVRAHGVHLNGFVRDGDGLKMWIGRRARDRPNFPGMLDNMVAGGQPFGISLRDNLIKECAEEADIQPPLAGRAVSVGAITYCVEMDEGLKPDVQFCYDLELPADFTPRNTDGEIEAFRLVPVDEVAAIVRDTSEFKFNCNLVIIDFLVRHGLIPPDHPDYLAIVHGLRRGPRP